MNVQQGLVPEPLKLWSVTTLNKVALGNSEALVNWAARFTAGAAVDAQATVSEMVKGQGRDAAVDWLARQRFQKSKDAAQRGTDLHNVFEAVALGKPPPPVSALAQPYVDHFMRWLDVHQPEFLLAEAPVYNLSYGYAGTTDGVMRVHGVPLIFDYKTTEHPPDRSRPPYPETALQLVAYRNAEEVGVDKEQRYSQGKRFYLYDPTTSHEPMPEVEGALVIVVSPHDCTAIPIDVGEESWETFRHVLAVARWQLGPAKSVFRAPLQPPKESAHVV